MRVATLRNWHQRIKSRESTESQAKSSVLGRLVRSLYRDPKFCG